ncbi:MAG: hypothetical protein ACI87O_002245 [Planctomycetota bacterium]
MIHPIPGNSDFDQIGIPRLDESSQSIEPPWYGPVCPVVWEGNRGGFLPGPYPDGLHFTLV